MMPDNTPMLNALQSRFRRWVLAMGLAALLPTALAQEAIKPLKAQRVAEQVWFIQGESAMGSAANENFISNAGFVVGKNSVMVVDALGSPHLAQRMVATIRQVTPLPIRHVVVTHYHADHIYGLQVFKDLGATVLGHGGAREYLQGETAQLRLKASREELFPWIDETTRLVSPDVWVNEEHRLDLGDLPVQVLHAGPAHTPEDLMIHLPTAGVLFAGDLVFRARTPYVGQADSARWVAAMDRVLNIKPRLLLPGHGPASEQPAADLALTRDYLVHLRKTMGEAARNLEPFDEAYARTDWSAFATLPLFKAVNRMNAYNTYILMEKQAP